jgi:hypothetical protein
VDSDVDSYQAVDKELVQEIADTLERRVQRMERVAAENHREPVQPLVLGSCLGLAAMLAALEHLTVALVVARMEMELKLRLVALALVDSAMSLEIADSTDCCWTLGHCLSMVALDQLLSELEHLAVVERLAVEMERGELVPVPLAVVALVEQLDSVLGMDKEDTAGLAEYTAVDWGSAAFDLVADTQELGMDCSPLEEARLPDIDLPVVDQAVVPDIVRIEDQDVDKVDFVERLGSDDDKAPEADTALAGWAEEDHKLDPDSLADRKAVLVVDSLKQRDLSWLRLNIKSLAYLDSENTLFVDTAVVVECSVAVVAEDHRAAVVVEWEGLVLVQVVRCSALARDLLVAEMDLMEPETLEEPDSLERLAFELCMADLELEKLAAFD